jgi:S-formylglutathione hydrolase FrmB
MRIVNSSLVAAALFCFSVGAGAKTSWNNPLKRADPSIRHATFQSASLRTDVGYNICLPPQYGAETSRRFPVIYYLHGYEGHESSFPEYARYWKDAVSRSKPVILVFVNGGETSFFCDSADGALPGETVIKELVAHIDQKYRTTALPSGRSLHGYSMGGFGALKLAFKYPEVFGSVVAYGATLPDASEFKKHLRKVYAQVFGNDTTRFADNDPLVLAERRAKGIRDQLDISIVVGTKDEFLPRNRALRDKLVQLGIAHAYREIPGAGHSKDDLYEPAAARGFDFSIARFDKGPGKATPLDKR